MRAAASRGRRFAVITHTGRGWASNGIARGRDRARGSLRRRLGDRGDPAALMSTPARLECALLALAERAVTELGAEAIVVGGGPLGPVARALSGGSAFL